MKPFAKETANESFEDVVARRESRRAFLKNSLAAAPLLVAGSALLDARADEVIDVDDEFLNQVDQSAQITDRLGFQPIELNVNDRITTPAGYATTVLLKWGDPLFPDAPEFSVARQTPAAQARQFGYNCDFVGYYPLPVGSNSSTSALLVVNHEYTTPTDMFLGYQAGSPTADQVNIELAAHGVSVVEIERTAAGWRYRRDSRFNRRITGETEMLLTGPAAGSDLVKTNADPTGTRVRGTLNNCAAGKTPWGTVLTCEENFNQYFANASSLPSSDPRRAIHTRYGLPTGASPRRWENIHDRFDIAKEPNEAFRHGYVVEFDPYDPTFVPRKRTALGRTKHEAATCAITRDGRVAVYSGDDERFDYMYKFVTRGRYDASNRAANFNLLDEGTLYVAKFNDDGTGEWIPMIAGQGPLANWTPAEVCVNTRGAADLLGATRMDRPEDIEPNPVNGKIYALFTNNTNRGVGTNPGTNASNPRATNRHGHIIELTEDNNDGAATRFRWEIFMLCGDPANQADGTFFANFDRTKVSAISCPDNLTFDKRGNMWVATDGMPGTLRRNDTVYAVPVSGPNRGRVQAFLSGPVEAEICGPEFNPNNDTFFCAIQHPGEGGALTGTILSTWPDGSIPARPSVIAVVKTGNFKSSIIGRA